MEIQTLSSYNTILITCVLFIFLAIKLIKKSSNSSKRVPPGPWKLPIIGNVHQIAFSRLLHRKLHELALKHGPLMHLQLGGLSTIVVSSPDYAKEIMKTQDLIFCTRPFMFAVDVILSGKDVAFVPYGEYWRQVKKICVLELLSAKRVQSYKPIREKEVSNLIKSITSSAGMSLNLSEILTSTTMRITAVSAFGNVGKHHASFLPLIGPIAEDMSKFHFSDLFPSLKMLDDILPSPVKGTRRALDVVFANIITEHRELRKKREQQKDGEVEDFECLVDVLMKHEDQTDTGFALTPECIQAIIVLVFGAGIETSATAMEWAISEMMKNPRVLQKAQAEVRNVFHGREIKESELHSLEYLKLVIKEALRLHPPLPLLLPRESMESAVVDGYEIPSKTRVIVNAWAIGRDPRYWNEPEQFYPERFLDSSVDYKGMDFELIPFGSGRRICPGISSAIASIELILANLLNHFDWSLPHGKKVEDLDMVESVGVSVRRKNDLYLIPTPYNHSSI